MLPRSLDGGWRLSQRALVPRLVLEPREAAAIRSLEGEEVWILRSP